MKIPGFDIVEKLGSGSIGTVWRAFQTSLNRVVAIKTLDPRLAANPDLLQHFLRQASQASRIKHPDVVHFFDVGEQDGTHYFITEYIGGSSVAELVKQAGPLAQQRALTIARHVAEALESAWHMFNISHHAVRPENIMLDEDGTVKVADLGLSLLANPEALAVQIRSGDIQFSPHYMSPEQARCDARQDYRSDIYSLGASLYYMVTGIAPFQDQEPVMALQKHVDGQLPNPRDVNPSISPGLAVLITRMMMKSPDDRYANWAEVIRDVRNLEAGGMLVQKAESYAGSTIRLPQTASPAGKGTRGTRSRHRPRPLPARFRVPAWLVLIAWLLFLAYRVLDPVTLLFTSEGSAPKARRHRPPQDPSVRTTSLFDPDDRTQRHGQALPGHRTYLAYDGTLGTTTPELGDVRSRVADAICGAQFVEALKLVEDKLAAVSDAPSTKELQTMRRTVLEASRMKQLIRNGASSRVDQEVVLRIKGKLLPVTLRATAGDRINATVVDAAGAKPVTNSVTFNISDLEPAERGKLLGPANTPGRCTIKFLLNLQGRDFETARIFAENCGPLAEAFMAQAEAHRTFGQ